MTFTDDFVVSAWVKLESYADMVVASRYNGTSGWRLYISASGQVVMQAYNAGAANISGVNSYASLPLNKWVHIAAQLDMSAFTATTTTSYVMIDGVDVAATVSRGGTNPTALVQAGNLEIGSNNGGLLPFDGKIAQVAIYSAKVTQATIKASMNQALSGSETSLISAYSLDNSLNDLNANANNLTAQGSAVATNADSPFANAVTAGLLEYAEINSVTFSTNTTVNVRVPDTCQIPTTGGVSAVSYSTQSNPYGLPVVSSTLGISQISSNFTTTSATAVQVSGLSATVVVPAGGRKVRITATSQSLTNSGSNFDGISIWDGTVGSGTQIAETGSSVTATTGVPGYVSAVVTPVAGSKTYNLGMRASAGTGTLAAGATYPAYIQVELV